MEVPTVNVIFWSKQVRSSCSTCLPSDVSCDGKQKSRVKPSARAAGLRPLLSERRNLTARTMRHSLEAFKQEKERIMRDWAVADGNGCLNVYG